MTNFQRNVLLSTYSNYKIGGSANYFFEFHTKDELKEALSDWKKTDAQEKQVYVIGDGTNILFSDSGFAGLILKDSIDFIEKETDGLRCGSGTKMSELVSYCEENSLAGLEWAGGLPGTIGGAVRGNAGAFGGETKDHITRVESINKESLQVKTRTNSECNFGYRMSVFKKGEGEQEIVLSGVFKVKPGNKAEIEEKTKEKEKYREDRHPLDYPNIGSTFKNIPIEQVPQKILEEFKESIKDDPFPILPVAKILAVAGLKGKKIGGAMVSSKHPNFIVNTGGAKATDVKNLVAEIKNEINKKYGISLEEEIIYL